MKLKSNILVIFLLLILNNCAAVGYIDSDDYQTILFQGHNLEKSGRMAPANKRYLKALQLAEEKGDKQSIAHAKYYLGLFYRNSTSTDTTYYDLDKSIQYLKESLSLNSLTSSGYPPYGEADMYTALTEVYDKKGNKKSACVYLNKLNNTYNNRLLTSNKYNPKYFYNATGKKFSNLGELIEYYNQKIGCGI